MKNCPWYIRWWHRRLRRLDEKFMFRAIVAAAEQTRFAPMVKEQHIRAAWDMFKMGLGQEHWRCNCAIVEKGEEK